MAEKKSLLEKKEDKTPVSNAHTQAEKDIESDPETHLEPEQGDDLDEGELARLEGKD